MRRKLTYTLLAIVGFISLTAQVNLVQNGSFEDISQCPTQYSFIHYALGWFRTSFGSPDLYNECGSGNVNVPNAGFGFQYAQEGNGFSGGAQYDDQGAYQTREYIGGRLLQPLKPNHYYCFKMYVSLADLSNFIISSISSYFATDSIFIESYEALPFMPQIENNAANFVSDSTGWQLIEGLFKATGGEKYIYIGNFKNNQETTYLYPPIPPIQGVNFTYIYFDNIQLYECDSLNGVEENSIERIKIYPNPAQDFVNIVIPQTYTNTQLNVYNLTGQIIMQKQLTQSSQQIPITELGNGMYIFVVQNGDRVVGRQRVVLAR